MRLVLSFLFVVPTASFMLPAPVSAANVLFSCWCQDESTRSCNHHRIDSGIESTDATWTAAGIPLSILPGVGPVVTAAQSVQELFRAPALASRREEIGNLCIERCQADGNRRAIHFETTYREDICNECNADPDSSCTEDRGARKAFGDAQTEQLLAQCEERRSQSLLPMQLAVPIGGITQVSGLADYINVAYRYLVTIVLVVAIVMVVYGGFRYLVGASLGDIQAGKKVIVDAIVGMLIVLGAYTLLSTVNPSTTLLSFSGPEPIECRDLDLPDAVKNSRCSSDSECASGMRCVEGRNYVFSVTNVAKAAREGAESGRETGKTVAEGGGVLGFIGNGVTAGDAAFWGGPQGLVAALISTDVVRESGAYEAAGALIGATVARDAEIISEIRRDVQNVRVCSTGEQGSPCLEDQSCRAGLRCMQSWSICWPESGNRPGQPCDTDAQCANNDCVTVAPRGVAGRAFHGVTHAEWGDVDPDYPFRVCRIDVQNGTTCLRANDGASSTIFPIHCNGNTDASAEFVCAWCPAGSEGEGRAWTMLNVGQAFPAQCKPRSAVGQPCGP